jgi:thiosulfate dehydrogenase [quinone] large subunit
VYHLQPNSPDRVVSRDRRFQRMAATLAALRILVGLIWLTSLVWKLPPGFGRDGQHGLNHWLLVADQHALGPVRTLVHDVLLPHLTVTGWLVFSFELVAGLLLVLGWHTSLGATLGLISAITITLMVAGAPGEWRWAYLVLIALNAVPLAAPANLRLSIDAALGRA